MTLTNFTGSGVGFGFGVGCGFGVGWGFGGALIAAPITNTVLLCTIAYYFRNPVGIPLNLMGLGAGGGCGLGLGLGWGFGSGFGSQYHNSTIKFQGVEFGSAANEGKESKGLSKNEN